MAKDIILYDGEKYKSEICKINYLIAAEVLNGTDEGAYNILVGFGAVNLIPVLRYTTIQEIAKFYGVSDKYLKSVFYRNGVTPDKMPTDAKLVSKWTICDSLCGKVESAYPCYHTGNLCFKDFDGKDTLILARKGSFCIYSPKVFLAAAAMMYFGRHVKDDSVANKIIKVLEKSEYGLRANRTFEEFKKTQYKIQKCKKEEVAQLEVKDFHVENQSTSNCDILISADVFKMLLYSAAKDAVREVISRQLEAE